jgi:transposase
VPRTRPPYPPEFRWEAIKLVGISSKSQHQIAEDLGISDVTLRNWVRQAERDEGKRPDGLSSDEREELARLRRENQTLRMKREILKKAARFSPGRPASRRRDLRADRGGEGEVPGGRDVPNAGGEPHQLSRLGASRAV